MKQRAGYCDSVINHWMLIAFLLIITVLYQAKCLKCVKCSTMDDPIGCTSGNIEPEQCAENDTLCIKYESVTPSGSRFAIRDCADNVSSVGCKHTIIENRKVEYCYIYCYTDGCNSASFPSTYGSLAFAGLISLVYTLV